MGGERGDEEGEEGDAVPSLSSRKWPNSATGRERGTGTGSGARMKPGVDGREEGAEKDPFLDMQAAAPVTGDRLKDRNLLRGSKGEARGRKREQPQ